MKAKTITYVAAGLGIVAGLLSFLSGSAVLLGIKLPDYTVIEWLVIYNIIMGIISMSVGISIFFASKWAFKSAVMVAFTHLTVLTILLSLWYFAQNAVAVQSLAAMAFRTILWVGIARVVWQNIHVTHH